MDNQLLFPTTELTMKPVTSKHSAVNISLEPPKNELRTAQETRKSRLRTP